MGSDIPTANSEFVEWEFFMSGIVWILYSILLLYLFHEHNKKLRYPQNIIILLLALGAIIRTIWFIVYWEHGSFMYAIVFNRVAILLQFSALSILVLMWSRAVKIMPYAIKKLSQSTRKHQQYPSDDTVAADLYERRARLYHRITIIANILAWVFILGSLANESDIWYRINITALSALCIIESIVILVVGAHTAHKLQREIAPVYVSATGLPEAMVEPKSRCIGSIYRMISFVYKNRLGNRGLQIQKQILRTLLTTAFILSILFFIRSLAFWFSYEIARWSLTLDYICYPWFFYNIPELIPTLVLARGISPPDGILRRISLAGLFTSRNGIKKKPAAPIQNRTNDERVRSISVSGPQSELTLNNLNTSGLSDYINQSFYSGSHSGSMSANTSDPQYIGSVVVTADENYDTVRNTMTIDLTDDENRSRSVSVSNNAARHWKQYIDDDGLSEFSEYDIDDFVYRTTSFDHSNSNWNS